MSTSIDERVAVLKFDNKQFERAIKESSKSLDNFKKTLRFDKLASSLNGIERAISKVSFTHMERAIDNISNKFTLLGMIGVNVLHRISDVAVNAGENVLKLATGVEGVIDGFREYETQMGAVQTIMSNTASKGTTLEQVNAALDELNTYADQTIYNFTEMTRNIGTFTAAGVDLETSTAAIKGIANLAAVSGSTSQQASTAMYQLSQALASGTVKLMDWNSVVNAGMGGQVFQDALKETARVHGIAIDDIIAKQGSFRESLSEGWLTTEVLLETLQKFTGDLGEEQLRQIGYTEEQIAAIQKLGTDANDAATKVKTFSQLRDTLAEAAGSGWSQTFKILVGDFEEAKELWTGISNVLEGMINTASQNRNTFLEEAFGKKRDQGITLSLWKQFESTGLASDEFIESLKYNARAAGIEIDDLIEQYGSFEESLEAGWLTKDMFQTAVDWNARSTEMHFEWAKGLVQQIADGAFGDEEATRAAVESMGYNYDLYRELANKYLDPESYGELDWDAIWNDDDMLDALGVRRTTEEFQAMHDAIEDTNSAFNAFLKSADGVNGRDVLLQGLGTIGQQLVDIFNLIGQAWNEAFPPLSADNVFNLVQGFADLAAKAKLTETEAGQLKNIFKGIFDVVGIVTDVIGSVFDAVAKALSLEGSDTRPLAFLLDFFEGLAKNVSDFRNFIKTENKLSKITSILTGVFNTFFDVLGGVVGLFTSLTKGEALDFSFMDSVTATFWNVVDAFKSISLKPVADFISGIKQLFADHGVNLDWLDGITDFLSGATVGSLGDLIFGDADSGLKTWFDDLGNTISSLDPIKMIGDALNGLHGGSEVLASLFRTIFPEDMGPMETVKYWIDNIATWASGLSVPDLLNSVVTTITTGFGTFVTWVKDNVLPSLEEKFPIITDIKNAIDGIVTWAQEAQIPATLETITTTISTAVGDFVTWLNGLSAPDFSSVNSVEGFFTSLTTWLSGVIASAQEFLSNSNGFASVENLIEKIKEVIGKIKSAFGGGESGEGSDEGAINTVSISESETNIEDSEGLIERIGKFIHFLVDKVRDMAGQGLDGIIETVEHLAGIFTRLFLAGGFYNMMVAVKNFAQEANNHGIVNKISTLGETFAIVTLAIAGLGLVVAKLAGMDQVQVWSSAGVMVAMGVLISAIAWFAGKKMPTDKDVLKLRSLTESGGLLLISIAVGHLADVVTKVAAIESNSEDVGLATEHIALAGSVLVALQAFSADRMPTERDIFALKAIVTGGGLLAVAEAVKAIGETITALSTLPADTDLVAVDSQIAIAIGLLAGIARFVSATDDQGKPLVNSLKTLASGGGMAAAAHGISEIMDALSKFQGVKFEDIEGGLTAMTTAFVELTAATLLTSLGKFNGVAFGMAVALAFLAWGIGGILQGLADFTREIGDLYEQLKGTDAAVNNVHDLVTQVVDGLVDGLASDDNINKMSHALVKLFKGGIDAIPELLFATGGAIVGGYADIVGGLVKIITGLFNAVMGTEEGTPIVDAWGDLLNYILNSDEVDVNFDTLGKKIIDALWQTLLSVIVGFYNVIAGAMNLVIPDEFDLPIMVMWEDAEGNKHVDPAEIAYQAVENIKKGLDPYAEIEAETEVRVKGELIYEITDENNNFGNAINTTSGVGQMGDITDIINREGPEYTVRLTGQAVIDFRNAVASDDVEEVQRILSEAAENAEAVAAEEEPAEIEVPIKPKFVYEVTEHGETDWGNIIDLESGVKITGTPLDGSYGWDLAEGIEFDPTLGIDFEGFAAKVATEGTNFVDGYVGAIEDGQDDASTASAGVAQEALDAVPETQQSGSPSAITQGYGHDFGEGYRLGISECISVVVEAANELASAAIRAFDNLKDKFYNVGLDSMRGFANGISAGSSRAIDAAVTTATRALEASKAALKVESPSKEFEEVGMFSDEGLALGFLRNSYLVENASTKVGTSAIDRMKSAIKTVNDAMNNDLPTGPTIRPVMDLSEFQNQNSRLHKALNSYGDQLYGKLAGIDESTMGNARNVTQVYIDGAIVNDTPEIQNSVRDMLTYYKRLGLMR